jgi:aspartate-semialdehyde dehydrogenase
VIGPGTAVGIVGASGAVGEELRRLLAERGVVRPRLLGRAGAAPPVRELSEASFAGLGVVFFCAPREVAREWVPRAAAAGRLVVDNSAAFRMDAATPLVIPEVNGHLLADRPRVVANPNCSTILLLVAVAPIHRAFGCERIEVTTFQAVSGAGRRGVEELEAATRAELAGRPFAGEVFPEPAAFNVFSHDSPVDPATGRNGEEEKIVRETRRILAPPPRVAASAVRVAVRRSHCEAVGLTLARPASEAELRGVLAAAPGVELVDDRAAGRFPTARRAEGRGTVLVGRLRADHSHPPAAAGRDGRPRWRHHHLFLAGDQLLKGAALNALQIADAWLGYDPSPPKRAIWSSSLSSSTSAGEGRGRPSGSV